MSGKLEKSFKAYFDLINQIPYDKIKFEIRRSDEIYTMNGDKVDEDHVYVTIHCRRVDLSQYNGWMRERPSSVLKGLLTEMEEMFPYKFYLREYVLIDKYSLIIPKKHFS
jgi:hypothetical protein